MNYDLAAEHEGSPGLRPRKPGGPFRSQPAGIDLRVSRKGGTARIELSGELDVAAKEEFESRVQAALSEGCDHLVLDLRALEFMDSSGMLLLLEADELSRQDDFCLWIVGPAAASVRKALQISGLDKVLPLVDRPPDLVG